MRSKNLGGGSVFPCGQKMRNLYLTVRKQKPRKKVHICPKSWEIFQNLAVTLTKRIYLSEKLDTIIRFCLQSVWSSNSKNCRYGDPVICFFLFSHLSFEFQNIFSISQLQKMHIENRNWLVYSWIGFE